MTSWLWLHASLNEMSGLDLFVEYGWDVCRSQADADDGAKPHKDDNDTGKYGTVGRTPIPKNASWLSQKGRFGCILRHIRPLSLSFEQSFPSNEHDASHFSSLHALKEKGKCKPDGSHFPYRYSNVQSLS